MNIGTPPTDNLYKFLAITGLIILISTYAIYFTFIDKTVSHYSMLLQDIKADTYSQNTLLDQKEEKTKKIEKLKEELSQTNNQEKIFIENQIISLQNNLDDNNLKLMTINDRIVRFSAMKNALDWDKNEIELMTWFLWVGTGIGFLASTAGFQLWYTRLQKYQDEIVKQTALHKRVKNT